MARTLVRFVFPQFALRLTLVVMAMAIGIFSFARSYRIETLLGQLERQTAVVYTTSTRLSGFSTSETRRWLEDIAAQSGVEIAVLGADRHALYYSDRNLVSLVQPHLDAVDTTGATIVRPGDVHREYIAVLQTADFASWDEVRYLVIASRLAGLERDLTNLGLWLSVMVLTILVVVLIISYRVVRGIQAPLRHLQLAASRFADGDLTYRSYLPEPQEFSRLAQTMNSMAEQLTSRIDAIRSHRQQLETILSSMNEGVILVDSLFRLKSMNTAAQRLFNVSTLMTHAGEPRALLEAIRNSELFDLVRRAHRADSSLETSIVVYLARSKYMHLTATPVEVENEPHVLVVLNDITRLKELERIRRDFVANVSHELKTPITSILGFVETLSDGAIEDHQEAHRFLNMIAGQSHRLNAIIEDLLQLSRLEQNQGEIHRESALAHEIIDAVRSNVAFRAAERNIAIRDEYQGSPTVLLAPGLVQQALTNLTDNAIKYCPRGSTVVLRVQRKSTEVVFSVADDGPGIPLVDQPRLFERFFRVDKARSRTLGGTGLGLAIVKHIAQAHGGSVSVDSVPGRGSTFFLHLPQ